MHLSLKCCISLKNLDIASDITVCQLAATCISEHNIGDVACNDHRVDMVNSIEQCTLQRTVFIQAHNCSAGDYRSQFHVKAEKIAEALVEDKYDFGFLHIKAVDDTGHDQQPALKVSCTALP